MASRQVDNAMQPAPHESASFPPPTTSSPTTSRPASESTTRPTSRPTPSLPTSMDSDISLLRTLQGRLWNQAYDELQTSDPKLVEAYETILSAGLRRNDSSSVASRPTENNIGRTREIRCRQMLQLVQEGLDRMQKVAPTKLGINEGVQAVQAVRGIMEKAVLAAPEAAIGWVGVCLGLEILSKSVTEPGYNRKGIAYILSRMEWYWNLVFLLLDFNKAEQSPAELQVELEKHVMQLCGKLLSYQMKSACLHHNNLAAVIERDIVKIDDWAGQLNEIQEAEATVQKDMEGYNTEDSKTRLRKLTHGVSAIKMNLQDIHSVTHQIFPPQVWPRTGGLWGETERTGPSYLGYTNGPGYQFNGPRGIQSIIAAGKSRIHVGPYTNTSFSSGVRIDPLYEPLRHERQEIRLLTLIPPTLDTTILRCTLRHVPLSKAPPYIALSYHWGDPAITTDIEVNDIKRRVTVNLEAALRRLRTAKEYTIWADALCINQKGTQEKSLQVPRIGTIFRKASEVAIWLGEDLDIDETSREYLRSGTASKLDRDACLSTLPVFKHLLGRPYWRRVWIIQELAVASRISLYCGRYRIPWKTIDANCNCCQDGNFLNAPGRLADENVCRFTMLREVRADVLARRPIRLLCALYRTRSSLATDPRDKIFALLGLAYDGQHFVPEPSYMSSRWDNLIEFAASLVTNNEPLDFVYLRSAKGKVESELPSWVPDWTDLSDPVAHRQFDCIMLRDPHVVESQETHEAPDVTILGSELNAKGVIFDTVVGLGGALASDDGDTYAHETASPDGQANPYKTEDAISHIVYQTLVSTELFPTTRYNSFDGMHTDFHRIWRMESMQQLEEAMPAIVPFNLSNSLWAWLAENRSFVIHGQTIEWWTKTWSSYGRDRQSYAHSRGRYRHRSSRSRYSRLASIEDISIHPTSFRQDSIAVSRAAAEEAANDSDAHSESPVVTEEDEAYEASPIFKVAKGAKGTNNEHRFRNTIRSCMRLLMTERGYLGWAHPQAWKGDKLAILFGCKRPVILRTYQEGYRIVGDACLSGQSIGDLRKLTVNEEVENLRIF